MSSIQDSDFDGLIVASKNDDVRGIRNILMTGIGDIPTPRRRKMIYDGMSEAYRRGHTDALAMFLRYSTTPDQPLSCYILNTIIVWYSCAEERDFELGLKRISEAALLAGISM